MTGWEEAIEAATAEFIEQLEQRGFHADGRHLSGAMPGDPSPVTVQIEIPESFPFLPPVVSPPENLPRSWHRELEGAMCLYAADGRENLPWLDIDDFLQIVARWLKESSTGWAEDSPDLDLDRYFTPVDEPLVVYGDLDALTSPFVQLRRQGLVTRVSGTGSIPKKTKGLKKNRAFGYIASIGRPETPPASWPDLRALLPDEGASRIERAVREHRLGYLIVRYERGGVTAALVLRAWPAKSGGIELASVSSASEATETLVLRAGFAAGQLLSAKVAVIGAGAIGSFLCDLLARAGVGHITIYDPEIVRPGNLVRHLADAGTVGLPKPEAVKRAIEGRPFSVTQISAFPKRAPASHEVMGLFTEFDLVIDATATGGVTDMLALAAGAGGHRLISVCIQEEGRVVRVDVIPPLEGAALPPTDLSARPSGDELRYEAGCGDPVSQTPPFAVLEAASLGARHAVGMLTGAPISATGIVRDYR